MSISKTITITKYAKAFLQPTNTAHRHYEALRAFFVDRVPSAAAARRFGYSPGSFRVLCHQFRRAPKRQFFIEPRQQPRPSPTRDRIRERIIVLRKQNLSIYDISRALDTLDIRRTPAAVAMILAQEGFARLPRRHDEDRPPQTGPAVAPIADQRSLNLSEEREFRTQFGGLFLFLPYLAAIPFDDILSRAGLPGSQMIGAGHAIRSLLGLKLFGRARHSHIMSSVFDQGLALFAGLNVIPKRAFLTEYSGRVDPRCYPALMRDWFDAVTKLGLRRGVSFHLDFHTIPFHGEDALVEKHYVSKRSRRQKGMLAFLAQDADQLVLCYANSDLRKQDQADEILRFVDFWKQRTGKLPEELVFDSKLTTYANLDRINKMGIDFITLRRRSDKMLAKIQAEPASAWRRLELDGVSRIYRTPRVLDRTVELDDYDGAIRQLSITDLGHEEPTLLLTNQLKRSAAKLIERYAKRMLIENGIQDGVDFFHMDALSSAVAMKVNLDLQLTLMASSLYRLLGARIGHGYTTAKSRHIFRDFIEAAASIVITAEAVDVHFQKRAHNPLLLAADFDKTDVRVPWLGNKRLRLFFGR